MQLPDGSFVFLVAVQHVRSTDYNCCQGSVWAFTSPQGLAWTYSATVALYPTSRRVYQEGFSENAVVLLKDNKTLWTVIRTDSADGQPSHRTLPFLSSTSTDFGHSWAKASALPDDMLSSTPKATVLGNGALLVSSGHRSMQRWQTGGTQLAGARGRGWAGGVCIATSGSSTCEAQDRWSSTWSEPLGSGVCRWPAADRAWIYGSLWTDSANLGSDTRSRLSTTS